MPIAPKPSLNRRWGLPTTARGGSVTDGTVDHRHGAWALTVGDVCRVDSVGRLVDDDPPGIVASGDGRRILVTTARIYGITGGTIDHEHALVPRKDSRRARFVA